MSKLKKKKDNSQTSIITSSSDDDYFDDCPVCQALKKAEKERRNPTLLELKEATLKAKDQGAVVGGSMFDQGQN